MICDGSVISASITTASSSSGNSFGPGRSLKDDFKLIDDGLVTRFTGINSLSVDKSIDAFFSQGI